MGKLNPWKFGAVLSLTVLINYALCTLFWFAFPDVAIDFLNGLFHGMDFRRIVSAMPFSAVKFTAVLAVFAVWSYVLGAIYAVIRNALLGGSRL